MGQSPELHVDVFGAGVPAILVHGSWGWGLDHFPEQPALADEYQVVIFDRRGFGDSPSAEVVGWPTDVEDVGALLDRFGAAHLVGSSSGGVVALLAASRWPEQVRSLTVIEPPLFDVAVASTAASARAAGLRPVFARARSGELTLADFLHQFHQAVGGSPEDAQRMMAGMSDRDRAAAETTMREQWWPDAPIDLPVLAAASFPKVVVNGSYPKGGDRDQVNDAICAALAALIRARRVTFEHSGHNPQVEQPEEFNRFLRDLWASAV